MNYLESLGLQERFWLKVKKDGPIFDWRLGQCWTWLGSFTPAGYGNFYIGREDGRTIKKGAHVVAYESTYGPVPEGKELDHLCRNRACPNPHHVEPVTSRVNLLRGVGPTARNAAKMECVNGHILNATNTRIRKNGTRNCKRCDAELHRNKRIRLGLPIRNVRGSYKIKTIGTGLGMRYHPANG